MKFILAVLLAFISLQAFASYKCSASIWSPGAFGTHYLSSVPIYFNHQDTDRDGAVRGLGIGTVRESFSVKYKYVLNGTVSCDVGECRLDGKVTEIVYVDGGPRGFTGMQYINLEGKDESFLYAQEDKLLKIKCR